MTAFPLPIGVAIITILITLQIMHDSCRIMKMVIMATPFGRAKRKKGGEELFEGRPQVAVTPAAVTCSYSAIVTEKRWSRRFPRVHAVAGIILPYNLCERLALPDWKWEEGDRKAATAAQSSQTMC